MNFNYSKEFKVGDVVEFLNRDGGNVDGYVTKVGQRITVKVVECGIVTHRQFLPESLIVLPDLHVVERSHCCHSGVSQRLRYRATETSPAEYEDVCVGCGRTCDVGDFIRNDNNGRLTDPETGEQFEDGPISEWD